MKIHAFPMLVCAAAVSMAGSLFAVTKLSFSDATELQSWVFGNGPEYPGAKGSLTWDVIGSDGYAMLNYDFTRPPQPPSDFNPKYVAIDHALANSVGQNLGRIEIEASWSSPLLELTVQFHDTTGQTFQTRLYPAFETVGKAWQRFGADIVPTSSHWGGVDDGVVHFPITGIGLLITPPTYAPVTGWMKINEITFYNTSEIPSIRIPLAQLLAPAQTLQSLDQYIGVCVHDVGNLSDLDKVRDLGMTWVRTDLYWSDVEKQVGKFDFSKYTPFLNAAKQSNLSVNFILCYGNPLYLQNGGVPPLSTAAIQKFVNYANAAVGTLGTDSTSYEVWNEPDNASLWGGTPNPVEYAHLLQATADSLGSNFPAAKTISAGLMGPGSSTFIDSMRSVAALRSCDGLGMHLYTGGSPEESSSAIIYCQDVASSESKGRKLHVTEWGYSTASLDPAGDGTSDLSRRRQASYLVRMALLCWWYGLQGTTFYDLRNDGTDPHNREHNFGLYDASGAEKPNATALKFLSHYAKGRNFSGMVNDPALPPWIHVACLTNSSSQLYILWSETPTVNTVSIQLSNTLVSDLYGVQIAGTGQTGSISIPLNSDSGPIYIEVAGIHAPFNAKLQVDVRIAPQ